MEKLKPCPFCGGEEYTYLENKRAFMTVLQVQAVR